MRVRVVLALGAIFLFGWLIGARSAMAGAQRPAAAAVSSAAWRAVRVTVRPGDSLWALGRKYAPGGQDLRAWIYRVERANGLHGALLVPGERLAVPAP